MFRIRPPQIPIRTSIPSLTVNPFNILHPVSGDLHPSLLSNPVFRRRLTPIQKWQVKRHFRDGVCSMRGSVDAVWRLLVGDELGQLQVSWFRSSKCPLMIFYMLAGIYPAVLT